MGMKGNVIIVGSAGAGSSHLIAMILAEVGMTMHDPFIYNGEQMTGEELNERIQPPKFEEPKVYELTAPPRMDVPEITYTQKDLENSHPFAKFMGKGRKGKRW